MAVDSLLASAPLTLTRQIVEQTSQTIELVRENVDKALLPEPNAKDQSLARPGTQPAGASKESSESGQQGKRKRVFHLKDGESHIHQNANNKSQ